jgi:hypothetical protein
MNDQFGSFGALSPDEMAAIKSALERRGMGDAVPALNQQSAVSATPAPQPAQAPEGDVMPSVAPTPGAQQALEEIVPEEVQGTPVGSAEAELIIKALSSRLKSLSNVEEAQLGIK